MIFFFFLNDDEHIWHQKNLRVSWAFVREEENFF